MRALRVLLYINAALSVVALLGLWAAQSLVSDAVDSSSVRETAEFNRQFESDTGGLTYEQFQPLMTWGIIEGLVLGVAYLVFAAKLRDGTRKLQTGLLCMFGYAVISEVVVLVMWPSLAFQGLGQIIGHIVLVVMVVLTLSPTSREYFAANTPGAR